MISFKEWSETVVVSKKYTNGISWSIDVWIMPDGTELTENMRFKGFLLPIETHVIVQIPFTEDETESMNCMFTESEDGLWFPIFYGENSLEQAYNFVVNLKGGNHE